MKYQVQQISGGLAGTDQTVSKMADFVKRALLRGRIRITALSIIERANVPHGNDVELARSLFEWVRERVRYVRDPIGVETVQSPDVTLRLLAGDCDDQSTLLAALAMSVGLPVRWRVIGESSQSFNHIYLEIFADGNWYPADTTLPNPFGQAPPHSGATKIYNFTGKGVTMLSQHSISDSVRVAAGDFTPASVSPVRSAAAYPLTARRFRSARVRPASRLTAPRGGGRTFGMSRSAAAKLVAQSVKRTLTNNWRSGLINRNDLLSYLRVIREGNAPFTGSPFFERHISNAIKAFHRDVDVRGLKPFKPEGQVAGLGELQGFLSSVWSGVKSVVSTGVQVGAGFVVGGPVGAGAVVASKLIPKQDPDFIGPPPPPNAGGWLSTPGIAPGTSPTPLFRIAPNINFPRGLISTTVPPESARAAVGEIFKSPWLWGALAVAAVGLFFVMRK